MDKYAPVLGAIACGSPELTEEDFEEFVALPVALFGEGDFFCLRTHGDSMIEVGIEDGDNIIVDDFLCQEKNKTRKRVVLAHEAGHIIMDLLNNRPITVAHNNEFDNEQDYSIKDLSVLFDIKESRATMMGVALLLPKTLVVNRVSAMIGSQKRIPLYGNSVLSVED